METNNAEIVDGVMDEITEQNEREKQRPLVSKELWPYGVAVWENKTQNGGTTHRVQLTVSRIDQNGTRQTDKVFFALRDAYSIASILQLAADEAISLVSERKKK